MNKDLQQLTDHELGRMLAEAEHRGQHKLANQLNDEYRRRTGYVSAFEQAKAKQLEKGITMEIYSATVSGGTGFTNGLTGRSSGSATVVVNEFGQYGFLAGASEPYSPIGGARTLLRVIDCLEFRSHDWKGMTVKRGRKLVSRFAVGAE